MSLHGRRVTSGCDSGGDEEEVTWMRDSEENKEPDAPGGRQGWRGKGGDEDGSEGRYAVTTVE